MENRKYSIAEVAEICHVSKATVSRVINNSPNGVSEKTRQQVLKTIEKLNYRHNEADHAGPGGSHTPGQGVGPVVQLLNGF